MDGQGSGHGVVAVARDSVEALVGDFGYEAVTSEFGDEPGDSGASALRFFRGGWGMGI